jgi:DUF4097 and DUF4098 domain-containing protein YvlB
MCPSRSPHLSWRSPSGLRNLAGTFFLIVLVALPAAASEQRQELTRPFDRTLTLTGGQSLRIENSHGDVRLTTHARPELRLQATIRVSADSQSAATEFLDQIAIDVAETPAAITVETRYPSQSWWRTRRNLSFSVDYTIVMPEKTPLQVRNSFGDVSVAGVKADAAVVNGHGALTASDGAGRHTYENSFGAIEVARMAGDVTVTGANGNVTATSIGGALTLTNRFGRVTTTAVKGTALVSNANGDVEIADAGSANVKNSFGPVSARDVRGPLTVFNSNGSVTATAIKGAAKVTSSFGPIDVSDVNGDANVENSNGEVKLGNVRGAATVTTSFATAEVSGVTGVLTLTNSNGGILLRDIGGRAEVRGSFGRVDADGMRAGIRVTTGNSGVRVVNTQGPVAVNTSFGPVELRNVTGKVDVRNQNGAIDAMLTGSQRPCQDVSLETSFSALQVQLPAGGYTVTAQTSFGKIRSDLPITATGVMGEGRLSGTIGGGGCSLQLTNANGDIRILQP